MFNPADGGEGAVKGGCPRCATLLEISETHQKMLALMRTFAPPDKKRKTTAAATSQISLFD